MCKKLTFKTGEKFGKLSFLKPTNLKNHLGNIYGTWQCDCGVIKNITNFSVKNGTTKSCGCSHRIHMSNLKKTHGLTKIDGKVTSEYRTWTNMKSRCYNKKIPCYKTYGGRGITVCNEWLESFENFIKDMGMKPSKDHSIDRIDVNGNYEPNNCRWLTKKKQMNNKNSNKKISFEGVTKNLCEWSEELKISASHLNYKLSTGLPLDEAVMDIFLLEYQEKIMKYFKEFMKEIRIIYKLSKI